MFLEVSSIASMLETAGVDGENGSSFRRSQEADRREPGPVGEKGWEESSTKRKVHSLLGSTQSIW